MRLMDCRIRKNECFELKTMCNNVGTYMQGPFCIPQGQGSSFSCSSFALALSCWAGPTPGSVDWAALPTFGLKGCAWMFRGVMGTCGVIGMGMGMGMGIGMGIGPG